MASGKSQSSGQKRAQGGGRTPNSEPKLQVFKEFAGMNLELSARPEAGTVIDAERGGYGDQTDLQMNYVFLQNNVRVAPNKTLEVRDELELLFTAPVGAIFTGPGILVGRNLFLAASDGSIRAGSLGVTEEEEPGYYPRTLNRYIPLHDVTSTEGHFWTDFEVCDDQLIGTTMEGETWTGDMQHYGFVDYMENTAKVPDPSSNPVLPIPVGDIDVNSDPETLDETATPYRISWAFTYVNKFGPTMPSPAATFWASLPVSEWTVQNHIGFLLPLPLGIGIEAIEMYYSTDNAQEMIFLDRIDVTNIEGEGPTFVSYHWYGYLDATDMWPLANLTPPTENYTAGTKATQLAFIDGRMYYWADLSKTERLFIGGNPGNLLSVSPGTGGGYVDVDPGTGQQIRSVHKYKTQSGNSIVTMLCSSQNSSREQRFNLVENSISLSNEQSMNSWQAEQVAGAVGCQSTKGALVCEDGLYAVNRYGLALTTMTMEYNSQIRTNYVSEAIKLVFTSLDDNIRLRSATLLEIDGILYMALGADNDTERYLDHVIFCYDIAQKAWWSYTVDIREPILNMITLDWYKAREGIGIVTPTKVYLLPTTMRDDIDTLPRHHFLIETAQLSTQMPQQGWQWLSQLEFHFDYFFGNMTIRVRMVDMFGRELTVIKSVSESEPVYDYTVRMRVDQRVMSYVIAMRGQARFRLTHFIARVYTMSNKVGQVWGFDDIISHRSAGSVRPTFRCYNDVRRALFT